MNFGKLMKIVSLFAVIVLGFSTVSFAQEEPTPTPTPQKRERVSKKTSSDEPATSLPTPTETPVAGTDGTAVTEETEIKDAILPVYNNYLTRYELGPQDVISVEVFGHANYSKAGIIVPPTGTISYQLIPGGIFVVGKTTDQIGQEIAKKLDEYIIDPQVTVTLERVVSAQFAVLGKVGAPGIRTMNKRYSVYDAIVESGGLAPGADKKRITLMRRTPAGSFTTEFLKVDEMVAGKVPMVYLSPGDQIVVPEKKWSLTKILDVVNKASAFRILFGSPI